jgi:N-sulfoglucosamine sulfohydrolase
MRIFLSALFIVSVAAAADRPPNIVWIVGENLDHDLGCYGEKLVATPHLDALAAAGTRYMRVFSTSPVCAPSRSAILTGMYQTSTDTHHMRSHRDDDFHLPPGVRPMTHRLKEAGYFTANIKTIGTEVVGTGKLDLNFVNEGAIYDSDDWSQLKQRQPFFAQINMPEAEYDIYDRKSGEKPRVKWVGEDDPQFPKVATEQNVTPPPYYPDHPVVRQEWARYLNSVSNMDRHIGVILQQLEKDGLTDDTIVIFFADNGRLEARGIHWCYDSGLRVPMIIRWPKNHTAPSAQPAIDEQVISLLDVTATTLGMAGIATPPGMQSRDLFSPTRGPERTYAFSARDRIDETVAHIRTVRDARYRYIRNYAPHTTYTSLNRYKEKCFLIIPLMRELQTAGKLSGPPLDLMRDAAPAEELYDIDSDPFEIVNLATSQEPAHREAMVRLRAALDTWIIETGDRGHITEAPEIRAPFEKEMHRWFGTPDWYHPPTDPN